LTKGVGFVNNDQIDTSQDVKQPDSSPPSNAETPPAAEEIPAQRDEAEQVAESSAAPDTEAASMASAEAAAEETQEQALEQHDEHASFVPRGTLLFLLVMLTGYALYWAYLWFIVVVERGAGGV
jgi:cobalamin biosynthesis protein CobT